MYANEIEYTVSATIDGTSIVDSIESISLEFAEDSYVNTVTIDFRADLESAIVESLFNVLCDPNINWGQERIIITINGIEHKFLLERRSTSIDYSEKSFSVWGRSKAATLDVPYSAPILDTEDENNIWQQSNNMASGIINNLLSGTGITIDFRIDDFPVYSDNFTVLNETPISIINKLVAVPGGRLRSGIDGNLIADYKNYTLNRNDSVQLFTELDELVQLDEEITNNIGYNKVEISGYGSTELEGVRTLIIETDEDCLEAGKPFDIKVYASPLTLDYSFDTTRGTFSYRGTETETITEEVVFTNGKGSTSKPIYSVVSKHWLGDSLGSVSHQQGYTGLLSANPGFGVLSITYVAKYDKYEVTISEIGTSLLYAVEDAVTTYDADGNPIEEEV